MISSISSQQTAGCYHPQANPQKTYLPPTNTECETERKSKSPRLNLVCEAAEALANLSPYELGLALRMRYLNGHSTEYAADSSGILYLAGCQYIPRIIPITDAPKAHIPAEPYRRVVEPPGTHLDVMV